jgi:hypothetical protein
VFPGNSLASSGSQPESAPRSRYVFVLTREPGEQLCDRDVGGDGHTNQTAAFRSKAM